MADSDLALIPGLRAKHRAVLAEQCQITTPSALARADRRTIHAAMSRLRPRPGLDEIAGWQDHARDLSMTTEPDPGWDQVAAFVVGFEQRGTNGSREQRLVAEQAERGSPVPRSVWPDWGCDAICAWMHEQIVDQSPPGARPDAAGPAAGSRRKSGGAGRRQITVDRLALVDADGTITELDPVDRGGESVECSADSRMRVSVGGLPASNGVDVALRVRRHGRPSWTPHPPTTAHAGKPVDIDLSDLPQGSHRIVLTARTSRGPALPCVVRLPRIIVRAASGQPPVTERG